MLKINEYRCECGHQEEILCADGEAQRCPCGKIMQRILSIPTAGRYKTAAEVLASDDYLTPHARMLQKRQKIYGRQKPILKPQDWAKIMPDGT